ncbi:MAG: energy-coupling factor ABC transporter ATP-binding protein [Anaerolineae bacterium]
MVNGSAQEPLVRLRDVTYRYGDGRTALQDISLDVYKGERVAILGNNGAGKSTLLLQLNGILRGEGEILIDGIRLQRTTLQQIRARVGLVFQDPNDQLFCPTVLEDAAFGPLHMGLAPSEAEARARRALAQVGAAHLADRMPHHLSVGEQRRAAIATVLSMDPPLLALDEPAAGLDPPGRDELASLLAGLEQTLLIATHDLAFVRPLCTRAVLLCDGRITATVPMTDDGVALLLTEAGWRPDIAPGPRTVAEP